MKIIGKPISSVRCEAGSVVNVGDVLVKDGNTYRAGTDDDTITGLDSPNIALGEYAFAAEELTGEEGVQMGTVDYTMTKRVGQKIAVYRLGESFIMKDVVGGVGRKEESLSAGDRMTIVDGVLCKYTATATDADDPGVYDYIVAEVEADADSDGAATLNFFAAYPIVNTIVVSGT